MIYLDKKFNFLRPMSNKNLIRAGVEKDGGYVVDSNLFENSDCLLSFGLGNDWSFEQDFLKKNKKKGIINIYDHTININFFLIPLIKCLKRFLLFRKNFSDLKSRFIKFKSYFFFVNHKKVKFYKEKITYKSEKKLKFTTVTEAFDRLNIKKKLILKIDIEGSEYQIIDDIINNYKNIEMILLEFHEIDLKEHFFIECVKKLLINFDIIHLHGNNHCKQSNSGIPVALEITMVNKLHRPKEIHYETNFPKQDLDFPNNPNEKDIYFSFK